MSSISNRLKHLEEQVRKGGVCRRCRNLPGLDIRFLDPGEDEASQQAPATCPDCGRPEPERHVVLITERSDGPQ